MPIPATTSPSPSRKGLAGRTGIEADSACRLIPRRCDEHCTWRDRDRRPAGGCRTNIGNVEGGRRVVRNEKAVDRNYTGKYGLCNASGRDGAAAVDRRGPGSVDNRKRGRGADRSRYAICDCCRYMNRDEVDRNVNQRRDWLSRSIGIIDEQREVSAPSPQ